MDAYFLSPQKTRPSLFGTPLILPCEDDATNQDLYRSVWQQVGRLVSPIPSSEGSGGQNHATDWWVIDLCSVLTGRKYELTACKFVKNGVTGHIYHSWIGCLQKLSNLWPSPPMTTKMENALTFVVKTCQVKCLNALDFVNKPQERYN